MMDNNRNSKIALAWLMAAVFIVTCILSALTPLVADDYNYAFNWSYNDSLVRIDNYTLLLDSMAAHRYYTHGRVLAQGLVSAFLMWPRWIFFVANALLVTVFNAVLVHFYRRNRVKKPVRAAACTMVLYWICMPTFGQIFLWLDGACNYFWAVGFAFIMLEGIFSLQVGKAKTARMLLLIPICFAVGSWSEHISFAALLIQVLYLIRLWVRKKKLPLRESLLLLVCCCGYLYLMMAPSMLPSILKYRAREAAESHIQTLSSSLAVYAWLIPLIIIFLVSVVFLLKRLPNQQARSLLLIRLAFLFCFAGAICFGIRDCLKGGFYALISSTAAGFLSLMCVFFFALYFEMRQSKLSEVFWTSMILSVGGLGALLPFAAAMYIPARAFCAPVAFVGIAAVLLLESNEIPFRRACFRSLAIVFFLFFVIGCADILNVHRAEVERQRAIRQALADNGILLASPYPEKTKYSAQYGLLDISEEEAWPKDIMKEYYGLKEIIVLSED